MEEYLIDRETLGKVIDELMKQRPLPVDNAEELNAFREKQMRDLDDSIIDALFSGLNEEQTAGLNQLLDQETENPDVFRNFFSEQNIDVEQIVTNAMQSFSTNFLAGGQNE